eukprot:3951544-Pleurochrysis_carterae.AAC.1
MPTPGDSESMDQPHSSVAHAFPPAPLCDGVMNLAGRDQGAACARRIVKSSDPNHPFHPYDD